MAKAKISSAAQLTKFVDEFAVDVTKALKKEAPKLEFKSKAAYKGKPPKDVATAFQRELLKGSEQIKNDALAAVINNVESAIWTWNYTNTRRWAGLVGGSEGSPRDIVDTGQLRNSHRAKISYLTSGFKIQIDNTAPYAAFVHWGGYVKHPRNNTKYQILGRPWISTTLGLELPSGNYSQPSGALKKYDIVAAYNDLFIKALEAAITSAK